MERWVAKVLALIGVFVLPLVCTILPIKISDWFASRGERGRDVLSWLMCFGGGVFFATFILHMGPEVRTILHVALLQPNGITYPVADLMMAGGFFLVLFIENIAVRAYHRYQVTKKMEQTTAIVLVESAAVPAKVVERPLLAGDAVPDTDNTATPGAVQKVDVNGEVPKVECVNHQNKQYDHDVHQHDESHVATRSLVLMLALSLHRIFEGMSVGLKHTAIGVGNMFVAVMCHETVIGFSLGLQLVKHHFTARRTLVYSFLCSIIMPIGVAIGTIIMEVGKPSITIDIVNGTMQAISTGTFIYVTFFEILQGEITHDTDILKLLSLVFGFAVMALLSLIPEGVDVAPSLLANRTAAFTLNTTTMTNL